MTRSILLLVLCLLAAGCAKAPAEKPSQEKPVAHYTDGPDSLKVGIAVDPKSPGPDHQVTLTFTVKNGGETTVRVPVPDAGTVTFSLGEGKIVGAMPGRPDRFEDLAPGKSLTWESVLDLPPPGPWSISAEWRSRSETDPFGPVETATVEVAAGSD